MTVKILKTGEEKAVEDCYALRLMEHGLAVPAEKKPEAAAEEKPKRRKKADDA